MELSTGIRVKRNAKHVCFLASQNEVRKMKIDP